MQSKLSILFQLRERLNIQQEFNYLHWRREHSILQLFQLVLLRAPVHLIINISNNNCISYINSNLFEKNIKFDDVFL